MHFKLHVFVIPFLALASPEYRCLVWLRNLYTRTRAVLGEQWMDEVTADWDYRIYHDFLGAALEPWEDDEDSNLAEKTLVINTEDVVDWMQSLLEEFDPMWVDNSPYIDGHATVFNRRSPAEREAAAAEKQAILDELATI
jgi:hypothetical protein